MNVKKSLKNCLLLYPSIFPNKWSVYHHWFCVNGNGYDWVKGELIDISDKKEIDIKSAIGKHFKEFERGLFEWGINSSVKRLKEAVLSGIEVDLRINDFTPKEKRHSQTKSPIYPLCEYAQILNIPKNIKPDWKEAAIEFHKYLKSVYKDLPKSDKKYIDSINL